MGTAWQKTACILCECNCGLEVQLGGDNEAHFVRIRGDKDHPISQGYACEKAHRLDYYQHGRDRITSPLRRREDGTFEEVDWDTAISEIAARLAAVRDQHGGESIFYYGGGGQGNHLPGAYSAATRRALGSRYRSNALAQEKTGEAWVAGQMFGGYTRGDFEHCEVGLFIGKNPWHSHGLARARVTLKELAKDQKRTMIVIDPRRSETAQMADIHLAVKPGTDVWLLAAMAGVLVQEDLIDRDWIAQHVDGVDSVLPLLHEIPVAEYCERAGIPEEQARNAARRIGQAESFASYEDLGVQMNRHSTLVSYVQRLLWVLTGNFAKHGTHYSPTPLVSLVSGSGSSRVSPVTESPIIVGLVPCNVISEEILTDHPKRFRAMIVETANPAHSLADSARMREALRALDTVVVIDIAMTETAREADYVLPATTQFEKPEATFFNFEFPANAFHLRRPLFTPPPGPLPEAEIHARLCEALGSYTEDDLAPLHAAAAQGRDAYMMTFFAHVISNPKLSPLAPVLLYRTLGPTLPEGLAPAAVLWGAAQQCAAKYGDSLKRAGFDAPGPKAADDLFNAILNSPSGVVFSVDEPAESWKRVGTKNGRIQLEIPQMLRALAQIRDEVPSQGESGFPFILSAGERRSFTANTIFRDPSWRKKDIEGALRMSPQDAAALGVATGDHVKLSTKRASAEVIVEVSDMMQPGHVSLPNGLGVDYPDETGDKTLTGVPANELTSREDRDFIAGTPWHKHIPARIEAVA